MVLPIEGHTKLAIQQEGLEALRHIKGPVVPLVVIGPYRSGKSFLLNQLLGVGCGESQACCASCWVRSLLCLAHCTWGYPAETCHQYVQHGCGTARAQKAALLE